MAAESRPSNQRPSDQKLIGIAFPFQKKNGKFPYTLTDAQLVKNDIILLFKTPLGSRVMRPNVGSDAESFVFESQGDLLQAQLRRSIRQTILNSGISVNIIAISFTENETELTADIQYEIYGVRDNLSVTVAENSEF